MKVSKWIEARIGYLSDKDCPICGKKMMESKSEICWCADCPYSNDEKLYEYLKSLMEQKKDFMMKISDEQLVLLEGGLHPKYIFPEWDKENDFELLIVSLSKELIKYRLGKIKVEQQ